MLSTDVYNLLRWNTHVRSWWLVLLGTSSFHSGRRFNSFFIINNAYRPLPMWIMNINNDYTSIRMRLSNLKNKYLNIDHEWKFPPTRESCPGSQLSHVPPLETKRHKSSSRIPNTMNQRKVPIRAKPNKLHTRSVRSSPSKNFPPKRPLSPAPRKRKRAQSLSPKIKLGPNKEGPRQQFWHLYSKKGPVPPLQVSRFH